LADYGSYTITTYIEKTKKREKKKKKRKKQKKKVETKLQRAKKRKILSSDSFMKRKDSRVKL